MQLQLRDQTLEAEDQPPVGGGRVVDTVLIGDEAAAIAAEVEQLIPVGTIAGQTRDVVGEDAPDLLEGDKGDEFLESAASLGGPGRQAEIAVNDLNVVVIPPVGTSPVGEAVLEAKALLMGQDLVGRV